MNKTKEAARNSGNYSTPKTSTSRDREILTQYERGTEIAAWILVGMFVFMAAWMWFAW